MASKLLKGSFGLVIPSYTKASRRNIPCSRFILDLWSKNRDRSELVTTESVTECYTRFYQ